jgi:hypothetical protein
MYLMSGMLRVIALRGFIALTDLCRWYAVKVRISESVTEGKEFAIPFPSYVDSLLGNDMLQSNPASGEGFPSANGSMIDDAGRSFVSRAVFLSKPQDRVREVVHANLFSLSALLISPCFLSFR